jgi:hypothetical protein
MKGLCIRPVKSGGAGQRVGYCPGFVVSNTFFYTREGAEEFVRRTKAGEDSSKVLMEIGDKEYGYLNLLNLLSIMKGYGSIF